MGVKNNITLMKVINKIKKMTLLLGCYFFDASHFGGRSLGLL